MTASEHREPELRYLTADEYALWDDLVERSSQGCVFCKTWWLQAAAPGFAILGQFSGDRLVAGIPLYFERHRGMRVCTMPRLTPTWGVIMEPLTGKRASVYTRELEIAKSFAAKLKQLGNFFQAFHPSAGYWLPFHWNGFSHTTHFTYVIDLRCSEAEIWEQMAPNIRTKIRKAERGGMVASECGADAVFDSVSEIFQSQGRKAPFTRDYLNRLNQAAQNVGAGVCLQATTLDGTVHATTFMVWSAARLYYLAGGSNPATKATGAQPFLVWQSIRFAKQRCAIFDFEGSMIESIETFFRAFGAERVGYTQVFRFNPLIRLYLEARGKLA